MRKPKLTSIHFFPSVDSPFLLPHLNELRISDEIADGHSLMLALLHYNESDDAANEENSNISSNGCDLNVSVKALVSADGALSCIPAKSDEEEITSGAESETYSESQSFAYPQDAHILPNHGHATGVHVPLFVVAESTNIKFLMISTLYQRFVLSIDEPLIGIEICNCNPVVRVYLGWLDKTATTVVCTDLRHTYVSLILLNLANCAHRILFRYRRVGPIRPERAIVCARPRTIHSRPPNASPEDITNNA